LTVNATVTDQLTASIMKAINSLIDALRALVIKINKRAMQVTAAAH
jgi:hypothetical protein